jgi:hypothetical protein
MTHTATVLRIDAHPRLHGLVTPLFLLVMLLGLCACSARSETRMLDDFETLKGWKAIHSHGDASKITIASARGKTGRGLCMTFAFIGYMGSVSIEKKFAQPLPSDYRLSFDIRAEAPVNNLVVRLKDSLGNVWWINRTNYDFPRRWSKFSIRKYQIQYGWGPSMGGELHVLDRIEIMIDVVNGGRGKVWFDNFMLEPIDTAQRTAPVVTASSSAGGAPVVSVNGRTIGHWMSAVGSGREWLSCDFGAHAAIGGLVIDWEGDHAAREFDVMTSADAKKWTTLYSVTRGTGRRNYIFLKDAEARHLRLELRHPGEQTQIGIARCEIKGPDFSFSPNEFFRSIAAMEPEGYYPRYLLQKQSYWTVVGVPGDEKEALVNEQGMIETDKLAFSLEPFLYLDKKLVTWHDARIDQSLDEDYLPIPTVRWMCGNDIRLFITSVASGNEGRSVLLVKYRIENPNPSKREGTLFIAARPFQVNPPWQTFTVIGGVSRIDTVACGSELAIDRKVVIPLSRTHGIGAAEFDQGDVTAFLKQGMLPPSKMVVDHFGCASAALRYDFTLEAMQSKDVIIAVPFHERPAELSASMGDLQAAAVFDSAHGRMKRMWESKLNAVVLKVPPSAAPIVNTIRTNLGDALINADGAGMQPGSRSYERSWIRDGALISTALLQMGIRDEVRRYLDWYAGYQFTNGAIPAVVEEVRGAERVPEHDSHGEFIYAVRDYFAFTRDTAWLAGKWQKIVGTVRHIRALRAECMTRRFMTGTPVERACYGLVPASISHEGYSWMPQHSYWDDFFILRGLKDAVEIARALGHAQEANTFATERDSFRACLYRSIRAAMEIKKIPYIPGCVELGDFSGLSTTIALTPCDERAYLPKAALDSTFDESYRQYLERKQNTIVWDAYLPYEARFIGAYLYMNRKDRALDVLGYLMRDRRPEAWNEWAEVVWKDRDAPKSIGDMPHTWVGSDFMRSVRAMFVYEREKDSAIVIGAGIPEEWVADTTGVTVQALPTYYGPVSYSMKKHGSAVTIRVSGHVAMPRGRLVVKSPMNAKVKSATVNGKKTRVGAGGDVTVRTLPADVVMTY